MNSRLVLIKKMMYFVDLHWDCTDQTIIAYPRRSVHTCALLLVFTYRKMCYIVKMLKRTKGVISKFDYLLFPLRVIDSDKELEHLGLAPT